jgi:hypothetical protein
MSGVIVIKGAAAQCALGFAALAPVLHIQAPTYDPTIPNTARSRPAST